MRKDMAKVVTEAPRRGHGNSSNKWGRRLARDEYSLDDHGASRAPIARRRQYGWDAKELSDLLGPLRRYLRKQVGRPWDKVWSEIAQTLDSRTLTGQHIFDHIRWEVEQDGWIAADGRLYHKRRWGTIQLVIGLYVHPVTRLLCFKAEHGSVFRATSFRHAQTALRTFGLPSSTAQDIRRFRVDGLRVWERRDSGWFIHTYRHVPAPLVRVLARTDGREVPIYGLAYYERVTTKQAGKKEIREATQYWFADLRFERLERVLELLVVGRHSHPTILARAWRRP